MGDCLLLTSSVRAIKEDFPEFRISVLVDERFADCFDGNPDFDEIIVAKRKFTTALRLMVRRFNLIINLHGGPTSLIYALAAIGRRIGAEQFQYSRLYHGLVPRPDPAVHTAESTMASFQWMGVRREIPPALRYEIHSRESSRIREKLAGKPYVVIHPASVMATKRWEAERFGEVGRSLAQRNFKIVVVAGPGEESFAGRTAQKIEGASIMLGLSIRELAEVIRGARLYIGNDSGPMHLAAAVGTPTIAVWGSSDSRRWRPWSVDHRVVQNPFECNPCPGYRCLVADSPLCIESVTVEQVNAAVEEILK